MMDGDSPRARMSPKVTTVSAGCRNGRARSMPPCRSKARLEKGPGFRWRLHWHEEEKAGRMSEAIRIMIVEDHAVVRQGLVALLRTVPDFAIVAEAADGQESIA